MSNHPQLSRDTLSRGIPDSNGRLGEPGVPRVRFDPPRAARPLKRFGSRFMALAVALAMNIMLLALFPLIMRDSPKSEGISTSVFSLSEPTDIATKPDNQRENSQNQQPSLNPPDLEPEPYDDSAPRPPEVNQVTPEMPDIPQVDPKIEPAPELITTDIAAPPPAVKPLPQVQAAVKSSPAPTAINTSQASATAKAGGDQSSTAPGASRTGSDGGESQVRYSLSEVDAAPQATYQPQPRYPARAKKRGAQGWAKIRFLVDQQGKVRNLEVTQSQPEGLFEDAILETVSDWLFEPGVKNGRQVETWVVTTIRFNLRNQ
ncbi:MAG: energy transducer TonB [Pseudomonadota bacterium]